MSIITEALEKAERPTLAGSDGDGKKPKSQKKRSLLFPKYILIMLAVFFAASFVYFLSKNLVAPVLTSIEAEKPAILGDRDKKSEEMPQISPAHEEKSASPFPAISADSSPSRINDTINLTGIMYTPEMPLAVINDSIWGEGETIGEFKILEIERDYIKLGSNGKEYTVRLKN